ncbi:MAG: 3-methyl-2-oxobutanoate hydroxymethyltransferase [Bacteriovoracaceae bacterium]|nr:3-methyl-2-oxobutanoate hydroxymethyltransferase [Bacteriovoracaceae bacterium]
MNVLDFYKMKQAGTKITMSTCYDFWSAKILNASNVDTLLVGDSLAMVVHGYPSTLNATVELMALHTKAVVRGATSKFIVSDMPFLSFRKGLKDTMDAVEQLMTSGANAIKVEGIDGHQDIVKHITQSGVPVMGHLGLTPQSIHQFGGHKVQATQDGAAQMLLQQAQALQDAGCFALVLECIPAPVAKIITENIDIATIGIGAGSDVDGQVLVLQDLLGMDDSFNPKFLKKFMSGHSMVLESLNCFHQEVRNEQFPTREESYK